MKRSLTLVALLLAAGSTFFLDTTNAHGGSYRGPGDTVPPGGGGGGGGGTGPSVPGTSSPSTGLPGSPGTPSPAGPGSPTGGVGGRGPSPVTGGGPGTDLTTWEFWWGFNKHQYLNLKAHVHAGLTRTGADDFFTGHGTNDSARNTFKPSDEVVRKVLVPALKDALGKERHNDIVTGSLIALSKIGDATNEDGTSEFEPILARFLADPNQEIAETAAVALGILANEASVAKLEDLALDTAAGRKLVGSSEVRYRTRAFATYGLGLIGARSGKNEIRQDVARVLIELMQRPDTSTRDVKVAAVVALGLTPIDVDPIENPGGAADNAASRQAQLRYLQRYFQDQKNHYMIRAHVPTAMARLLDGAPADAKDGMAGLFLDALDKNSKERDEVRQSCVLSLGMIGDSDADKVDVDIRAALKRMAVQGDQQSRSFTNIAMAQIGGRPGQGTSNDLGQKDARDFLLNQLTKGDSHMKTWAGIGIGVMEHALTKNDVPASSASGTAKDTLRKALEEASSPDHVGAFSIGVGIAGDLESRKVLAHKLKHTSEHNTRGYVAIGLGLTDARDSVKDIQAIVKESKYAPDLMKSAAIGLGLLGDKELVPDLVTMLGQAKGMSSQAAIATALGYIGDSRSVDPLVAMLTKGDGLTDSARGFAAVALGIVADKEPLPWNAKISTNINYRANTTSLTGENGTGILDIL